MELDLKLTNRVNMRLCGIPEIKFTEWAKKLTRFYFLLCVAFFMILFFRKGYKVARVDEIGFEEDEDDNEPGEEEEDDDNNSKKKPSKQKGQKTYMQGTAGRTLTERRLTQIYTPGTIVDPDMLNDDGDASDYSNSGNKYFCCIIERKVRNIAVDVDDNKNPFVINMEDSARNRNVKNSFAFSRFAICLLNAPLSLLYIGFFFFFIFLLKKN
jgi:DNA mismatch repair ATPase MutS